MPIIILLIESLWLLIDVKCIVIYRNRIIRESIRIYLYVIRCMIRKNTQVCPIVIRFIKCEYPTKIIGDACNELDGHCVHPAEMQLIINLEHLIQSKYFFPWKFALLRPNSSNMVKDVNHVQPPASMLFCSWCWLERCAGFR